MVGQTNKTVMIVAGGTGGHVFPGIAVANALKQQNCKVIWLGTKRGLDASLVPKQGIEFHSISMVALRGKNLLHQLTIPFRLAKSIYQALIVILKTKPDTILGMGGYVTAPAGIAAWILRKKLIIHEQNAIAGMANRYLSKIANKVLEAFPDTFTKTSSVLTVGNPVRKEIVDLPAPEQRFANREGKLKVLVIGGSLGAQAINFAMPLVLSALQSKIQLRHQTGKSNFEMTRVEYEKLNLNVDVSEFIDDMADAYGWADIVICRAGALTVSELAAAGLASILIPLPIAVDDHQTANAHYLTKQQAGILVPQRELTPEKLIELLVNFHQDRPLLLLMAKAARHLAMPDAANKVTANC